MVYSFKPVNSNVRNVKMKKQKGWSAIHPFKCFVQLYISNFGTC